MADKAFMFDTSRCCGCRSCHTACKQWNELPAETNAFFAGPEYTTPFALSAITWNRMAYSEVAGGEEGGRDWKIIHRKCFHCKEANCLQICPVGAISKKDGWTIVNQKKCIACGLCTEFCVYDVPHISGKEYKNSLGKTIIRGNRVYKCNACRINKREIPACVENCPTRALSFGHRLHILKKALQLKKKLTGTHPSASVYGMQQFGGLRMIYLLKDTPEKYGLPAETAGEKVSLERAEGMKNLFSFLSLFTFGSAKLKRKAVNLACRLEKINRNL